MRDVCLCCKMLIRVLLGLINLLLRCRILLRYNNRESFVLDRGKGGGGTGRQRHCGMHGIF